jgi:hypothetical protein
VISSLFTALVRQIDLDEQMRRRAIQQAVLMASAWSWRRRAATFEWARPRPKDFNGGATAEELTEADRRCREVAEACRNRATLIEWTAVDDE